MNGRIERASARTNEGMSDRVTKLSAREDESGVCDRMSDQLSIERACVCDQRSPSHDLSIEARANEVKNGGI